MNAWAKHREQAEFDAETASRIEFWKSLPESERLRLAQLFADEFGVDLHPAAKITPPPLPIRPPVSMLGLGAD